MRVNKPASISPVMASLSQYIASAPRKSLPSAALEATRHHVLDTLAAMVSGAKLLPGKMAITYAKTLGGKPAAMVAAGCTGVEDVFSGDRNFFVAFDESRRTRKAPDPEILVRDLGKTYEIVNTNIKRWTVGSPIQAPLDSLLELIRAHGVKADDVEKVVVRVSHRGANTVGNREMPDICMQHMCAIMLIDGIATFESAHDMWRMKDPRVLAVRKRIELLGDDGLEKLLPSRQGIVELTLKDGRHFRHHTQHVRGTWRNPMTRAEVDEKAFHLMAPVPGAKRARALCDTVWHLDRLKNVRKLRPLLQA